MENAPQPAAAVAAPPAPASPVAPGLPELVRFDKVNKSFGADPDAKIAVQDVSFVVHDLPNTGELIAVVGPSGCGKSTVLRMLAGLRPHFPPTTGTVTAFGKPIEKPGSDRGMVDQKYSLMPHLTVAENIAFGLKLRGVSARDRRDRAHDWAKKVGLDGAESKYPSELSGGIQQRVSIAATLILEPKILLMDEPFGALDPKIRMQMQELLVRLWREQQSTVFIVTHSMEEAVYLGDRVLRMAAKPGRLVEELQLPRPDESPEAMRKRPWFNEITQELLRRLETDAPALGELPGLGKWK
jgi:ABC-type nitrate/sulfonate/bicarbonate transport system ATPase subunit